MQPLEQEDEGAHAMYPLPPPVSMRTANQQHSEDAHADGVVVVVVDPAVVEVVVVPPVDSHATVATYPSYGPSCPGAGPQIQPDSHEL